MIYAQVLNFGKWGMGVDVGQVAAGEGNAGKARRQQEAGECGRLHPKPGQHCRQADLEDCVLPLEVLAADAPAGDQGVGVGGRQPWDRGLRGRDCNLAANVYTTQNCINKCKKNLGGNRFVAMK